MELNIRSLTSYFSAILSAVTLMLGFALWTLPTLSPVGSEAALLLSVITLSLPAWAVGMFYSLYVSPLNATHWVEWIISASIVCSIGLFFIGFVAVLLGTGLIRAIGDWIYAIASFFLFLSSIAVLLVERSLCTHQAN